MRRNHPADRRELLVVSGLGFYAGLMALLPAAASFDGYHIREVMLFYTQRPWLLLLNALPTVLVMWTVYLLTGRGYLAFPLSCLPATVLSVANFYKIMLRGDPLLARDLQLISEARGMAARYKLTPTALLPLLVVLFLFGLSASLLLLPPPAEAFPVRAKRAGIVFLALLVSLPLLYFNDLLYFLTSNPSFVNPWSETEQFLGRGFLYPFLHSVPKLFPAAPEGYSDRRAREVLAQYPDEDIPEGQRVDIVGIMLEAFSDLSDFPALADKPCMEEIYGPLWEVEEAGVSGELLTNIFAGGTVDSEWCFLTGQSHYNEFRGPTSSYVWYLRGQGYTTCYFHPGYEWFYNRRNINEYLGFQESRFSENFFEQIVHPTYAVWRSDALLVDSILQDLPTDPSAPPRLSFSVSYQNHGPYAVQDVDEHFFSPETTGWSEESCSILNGYLSGIQDTAWNMRRLTQVLEERSRPTVLVFFGDHKPWLGDSDSVYEELGVDFDLSTLEGFQNYYSTPYVIWANSAAKRLLGARFRGDGGSFSPCFLMEELFTQCGWAGPGYMQLARQMRALSPLVHQQEIFLCEGALCEELPEPARDLYRAFRWAQFYRQRKLRPASGA